MKRLSWATNGDRRGDINDKAVYASSARRRTVPYLQKEQVLQWGVEKLQNK